MEPTIWDAGRTRAATELARLEVQAASQRQDGERLQIAARVTQAWLDVQFTAEAAVAADAAVASAETDLALPRNKGDAGMSTDADVLAIEVHLAEARALGARLREQQEWLAFF